MKQNRLHYPVSLMARVFEVSVSGYHAWDERPPSKRAQEDAQLCVAIRAAHQRTRQTYSAVRLHPELAADGFRAGVGRIKRLRQQMNIRCKQKRKTVRSGRDFYNSNHTLPVAENLLNQTFATKQPNEAWVTDITYISTSEGWLYQFFELGRVCLLRHLHFLPSKSDSILGHPWQTKFRAKLNSPQLVKSITNPGHGAIGAVKMLTATLVDANHNVLTQSENGWPDHEPANQFPPRSDSEFLSGLIEHVDSARSAAC